MPTHQARVRQTRQESRERIVEAAAELVRHTPYAALTVDDVMREAGFGRTIFYRHFDDLGDLLMRAGREAIEELYDAQRVFAEAQPGDVRDLVRRAIEPGVATYTRHGPLLRAISEAAGVDERIAAGQAGLLGRFDELAAAALHATRRYADRSPEEVAETARALNRMNESYLRDAFGREPRVSPEIAMRTLTEIWVAVIES